MQYLLLGILVALALMLRFNWIDSIIASNSLLCFTLTLVAVNVALKIMSNKVEKKAQVITK